MNKRFSWVLIFSNEFDIKCPSYEQRISQNQDQMQQSNVKSSNVFARAKQFLYDAHQSLKTFILRNCLVFLATGGVFLIQVIGSHRERKPARASIWILQQSRRLKEIQMRIEKTYGGTLAGAWQIYASNQPLFSKSGKDFGQLKGNLSQNHCTFCSIAGLALGLLCKHRSEKLKINGRQRQQRCLSGWLQCVTFPAWSVPKIYSPYMSQNVHILRYYNILRYYMTQIKSDTFPPPSPPPSPSTLFFSLELKCLLTVAGQNKDLKNVSISKKIAHTARQIGSPKTMSKLRKGSHRFSPSSQNGTGELDFFPNNCPLRNHTQSR